MAEFREGHVDADGFRIRYQEAGRGEPLVAFHGAGGLRLSRAHELLAERRRVVAFELPGFGASPANDRTGSMQELADTMDGAIANLGIERCDLLGISFGGKLALWLAVRSPDRVRSLVLSGPAAIRPEDAPPPPPPGEELTRLLYAHPERQPALPPPDPAVAARQMALVRRLVGPPRDPELERRLPEVAAPVLVLFGTGDRLTPPEMGREYRRLLPNSHFVLVYDAAHAVDADRPEAFAAVAGDFLDRGEAFVVRHGSALLHP